MTIAAGFALNSEIVLCADTQESTGDFKFRVPKLEIRPRVNLPGQNFKAVFAGAGIAPWIDKLVDEMAKKGSTAGEDMDAIVEAMQDACLETHEKFWKVYPSMKERPWANMLIGISAGPFTRLIRADGPVINPVTSGVATVGCGGDLARYITTKLFAHVHTERAAIILALYLLRETKEHVDGCGGDSHVVVLQPHREHRWISSFDVMEVADNLARFESEVGDVLLAAPDLDNDNFEKALERFGLMLNSSRKIQKESRDHWGKIRDALSGRGGSKPSASQKLKGQQ